MKIGCNTVDFRKYPFKKALQWIANAGYEYKDEYPFEKLITHRFKIDDAKKAIETSLEADPLKVVFDMTM